MSPWLKLGLAATLGLVGWLYYALSPGQQPPEPPEVRFEGVAARAGIDFVHNNGASDDELLPETMGSGVAIFDFDSDGWQDLLFVNSTYWPWEEERSEDRGSSATGGRHGGRSEDRPPSPLGSAEGSGGTGGSSATGEGSEGAAGEQPSLTPKLYRNKGDGTFEDVTEGSGLDERLFGMGVAAGDFDNDGRSDVFLTAVGENRLLRNAGGGRFEDVTAQAGVGGESNEWSASAAWVDLDKDGWLDLFVCNYVRWSKVLGIELAFKLAGMGRGYGPQVNFTGAYCDLYLNNGDGTFRDVSRESGIEMLDEETGFPLGRSLAVAPIDLDEDGWLDLVVANHNMGHFVFRNLGGARFEEIGQREGAGALDPGGAMGIDAARLPSRDAPGVAVGSFANELNRVYFSAEDSLVFAEEALADEAPPEGALQRFGLFFFDFDLDGRLDLLTVNGVLEEQINRIESVEDFARPAGLYWNSGGMLENRFTPMTKKLAGEDLFRPIVGRGAAYGDLDGDGDLDVVMTQNGGRPLVLRNDSKLDRSWLRVKLVGRSSNRDGIAATVQAEVGTRLLRATVMPTRSYLSQSELPVTLGLGRATRVRRLTVYWPDGDVQHMVDLPANAGVVVRQE